MAKKLAHPRIPRRCRSDALNSIAFTSIGNHPYPASDDGRDHDLDNARPIREDTRTPLIMVYDSGESAGYDAL